MHPAFRFAAILYHQYSRLYSNQLVSRIAQMGKRQRNEPQERLCPGLEEINSSGNKKLRMPAKNVGRPKTVVSSKLALGSVSPIQDSPLDSNFMILRPNALDSQHQPRKTKVGFDSMETKC
jgi:hypothetical protein